MSLTDNPDVNSADASPQQIPVLDHATPNAGPLPGEPPPPYKLFNAGAVTLASFLGAPLAGAVLMAINFRRLDRKRAANITMACGVGATAVLIGICSILPDRIPIWVTAVPPLIVTISLAQYFQGEELQLHTRRRGQLGSRWTAAGIGLICLAVLFGLLFGAICIENAIADGKKINYSSVEEVRFSGQANQADARNLGDALKQAQFFDGENPKTVLLAKRTNGTTVSFVVGDGRWDNPNTIAAFHMMGDNHSKSLGRPLMIRLCDSDLTVKKEIPIP